MNRKPSGSLGTVLILGAAGGQGQALARKLRAAGQKVVGVDINPLADEAPGGAFVQADVSDPNAFEALSQHRFDAVFLALPTALAIPAVENVFVPHAPKALLVDFFSEKHRFAQYIQKACPEATHLGVHLLFAPSVDWQGQNALLTAETASLDARGKALARLLETEGVHIRCTDPREHDRLMSVTQVGLHAAVAAYARFMSTAGVDTELLEATSTPAARTLWAMAARMIDNDPAVYWEIQRENAFATEARSAVAGALRELSEAVEQGDETAFNDMFDRLREHYGQRLDAYTQLAQDLYSVHE